MTSLIPSRPLADVLEERNTTYVAFVRALERPNRSEHALRRLRDKALRAECAAAIAWELCVPLGEADKLPGLVRP
jgi:hypothetical protein